MPNTCGSCAAESDAPGVFTCSNRVGKGNHAAVARLAHFMRALRDWEGTIARFFAERLQLELKAEPGPRPVTAGADFLGYIVRPDYVLVRRRVVGNLRLKLASFARAYVTATSLRLPPAGLAYAFVAEEGFLRGGMKRRLLRFLHLPLATGPEPLQADTGRET